MQLAALVVIFWYHLDVKLLSPARPYKLSRRFRVHVQASKNVFSGSYRRCSRQGHQLDAWK